MMKRGIFEAIVRASVLTAFLSVGAYATDQIRVVWDNDPSSTATIGFANSEGSYIKIGTSTVQSQWTKIDDDDDDNYDIINFDGTLTSKFLHLSGLIPNQEYYFKVCDDEGCSENENEEELLYYFKTAATTPEQMTMIAGGDSRRDDNVDESLASRIKANKMVAKIRPDFIAFGGDYTKNNNGSEMSKWLDDWQLTFSIDEIAGKNYNRVYPIVPTQGNHEQNVYSDTATICKVFGINQDDNINTCTNEEKYYAINIGNLVRLYTLNTEINDNNGDNIPVPDMWDAQQNWLETDLAANDSSVTWRVAQYHRAMIPSIIDEHGYKKSLLNIRKWGPVFEEGKLNLAIECDTHIAKYTLPVEHNSTLIEAPYDDIIPTDLAEDADPLYKESKDGGTVYIGEGGWGVEPREPRVVDKSWFIDSEKIRQFKVIQFDKKQMKIRSVMFDDTDEDITGINRNKRNEDPFALPSKMKLWNPKESDSSVVDTGDVYTLELSENKLSKVANVIEKMENVIRKCNNGISLVNYQNNDELNYYLSWSTSKGDCAEHNDLYYTNIYFSDGTYHDDSDEEVIINDNAQNSVLTTSIYKNSNLMLSVWEDDRKSIPEGDGETRENRVEVRGQVFEIGVNGSIVVKKEDFRIDQYSGGETHSPTVTHVEVTGTNEDLYVVAYVEDDSSGSRIKVRLFDVNGTRVNGDGEYLTDEGKNSWWPVSATNDDEHAFIGWVQDNANGLDTDMSGCVLTVNEDYDISCASRYNSNYRYLDKIKPYNYQVAWLEELEKFFIIAKIQNENNSKATTIEKSGSLAKRNESIEGYPIVRQAQLAVTCQENENVCRVVYPAGENDLGILKVTNGEITLKEDHWHQEIDDTNSNFTVFKTELESNVEVANHWPTTGIAVTYAENWGSNSGIWESNSQNGNVENKLLFLFNDVNGNLFNLPLLIDVGF